MAIKVRNNLPQVLHTSGFRNGAPVTLIIPANHTVTCDSATPVMLEHAKSRMVTITEIPAASAPNTPATNAANVDTDTPSETPTTNGGPSKSGTSRK